MTRATIATLLLATACTLSACSSLPSWLGGGKKQFTPLPGERVAALASRNAALAPDPSLEGLGFILPEAQACASWPQHGGNSSAAPERCAFSGVSRQDSARVGGGEAFAHGLAIPPVVDGGRVYAMDAAGEISAHDAASVGKILWQSKGVQNADDEPMLGGGLAVDGGVLYAVSGRGLAAAFDAASGKPLWRQEINLPVRAAPRVAAGTVYVVTADSQLFALAAKNGEIRWTHRGINENASFLSNASPAVSRELVVAPYSSGEIYILDAESGRDIWQDSLSQAKRTYATGAFTDIGSDPVIIGNALYAVSSAGLLGAFRLDNGQRIWEQPVASLNTLWVAGDRLFVLSSDDTLAALNRMDGRVYWSVQLPRYEDEEKRQGRYRWSGPVLAGDALYIAGAHGQMRVFSPQDGSDMGRFEIPEGVNVAPIVAGGVMYLVGADARLTALH